MPKEFTVDRPIEQMNEQDRCNDVRNRYFTAHNYWQDEKSRQEENGQFARGVQWSGDQARMLREQNRDVLVWNKIIGHVGTAVGTMQMNKFDSIAKPIHSENQGRATLMNYLLQYQKQHSDLDFLEPKIFEQAAIFNYGIYELRLVSGRDYKTDVKVYRADPLHIFRDPNGYEDDLSDCDYIMRDAWMTKEQLKKKFPQKVKEIEKNIFVTELFDDQIERSDTNNMLVDKARRDLYVDISGRNVKVIEYWHFKYENKILLYNPETDKIYYPPGQSSEDDINKFLKNYPHLEMFRRKEKKLHLRTIAYNTLLYDTDGIDEEYPVQTGNLPFFFNWWFKFNRETFGLVEILKDPQREVNKRRTTFLLGMAKAVRGGWTAEEGSIDVDQWAANPDIRFVRGGLNRVKELDRPKLDQGFFQYDRMMQDDMDDQGMPRASRGQSEFSNESGRQTNIKITQANIKLLGQARQGPSRGPCL